MMEPKITFGIIVVNGEPFTKYCLRSIYPYAYEIIVVEGGHEDTFAVTTTDGHSTDRTLDTLYQFKEEEDPDDKIQIVTQDGHWKKVDELGRCRTHQSRAYAERATGDYLWQVDIDEFYRPQDIQAVIDLLRANKTITQISFLQYSFWGGIEVCNGGWGLRRFGGARRVFKWGKGYNYKTHEPPTITDERGNDLDGIHVLSGKQMSRKGIRMYHYSLLFPQQVYNKVEIYKYEKSVLHDDLQNWAENSYYTLKRPYRVHNLFRKPSWLERFKGEHPYAVYQMIRDVEKGQYKGIEGRDMEDAEKLLSTIWYPLGAKALKVLDYIDYFARKVMDALRGKFRI